MLLNKLWCTYFLILSLVLKCSSLKILAIMPHVGKSHQLVFEPLFKKLVLVGHDVTLITRFPPKINSPQWRAIEVASQKQNQTELFTFDLLTGTQLDRYTVMFLLSSMAETVCSEGLAHPNLHSFLKEDNKFDVVLLEIFNTNCFMGVAKRFDAPIIGLHSASWMPWMYQWFGIPYNPAYLPNHLLGNTDEMSFFGRVENTISHFYCNIMYRINIASRGNALSKKYTGIDLYEHGDLMKSFSLFLINSHFTLNLPIPLVPNAIEVGGIHMDSQQINKLPKDIEDIIKTAPHGIIYMSMGSTIQGDSFPESKKQAFFKAFSKLPQKVIWKWEGEMKNKPDNVYNVRWAPQKDILCHPKVKVFISHAGLLGVMESVHCGKPMLMLPQFGDQFTNAAAVQKREGGVSFLLSEITEEVVLESLKKLLSAEFAEKAQLLSKTFKDRPLSPTDTALYWIDYVINHKGAPFMKTTAVDMPLYQYWLLDVLVFISVVLLVLLYLFYRLANFFVRKLFKKENKLKES
ncbi:UDP-glycosyltransferase UGT5-like [Diabrotica undecimpunctata]|uniref:UDP-glycosyltransferase UGT5-like n=1 Tax=Diabrotica undecimpunctata TaxID=50387 RepID=UPI003B63A78A